MDVKPNLEGVSNLLSCVLSRGCDVITLFHLRINSEVLSIYIKYNVRGVVNLISSLYGINVWYAAFYYVLSSSLLFTRPAYIYLTSVSR